MPTGKKIVRFSDEMLKTTADAPMAEGAPPSEVEKKIKKTEKKKKQKKPRKVSRGTQTDRIQELIWMKQLITEATKKYVLPPKVKFSTVLMNTLPPILMKVSMACGLVINIHILYGIFEKLRLKF